MGEGGVDCKLMKKSSALELQTMIELLEDGEIAQIE